MHFYPEPEDGSSGYGDDEAQPEEWCEYCDRDAHTCPGCGEPVEHGETCCDTCYKTAVAG